jgi:tetratricopeptide (TPR) repeat protein
VTEPAAAQLDEAGEREWALLHDQFDLADGFWIGFMFSPAYTGPRMMAERVERKLQPAGHALRRWQVAGDPAALRDLPSQVVAAGREGTADCLWVEALENDLGDRPAERSWTAAWSEFLMRLNERREVLVRHHQGALMVVAPPWVKPLVWERAPDLWAYRAIVVELEVRGGLPRPRLTLRSFDPLEAASLSVEEASSLGEAERTLAAATRFTQATDVLRVTRALIRRGRWDKVRELAAWVLSLPREQDAPQRTVALCFYLLATAEMHQWDYPAAIAHLERARDLGAELDREHTWAINDMLARLRYDLRDLSGAHAAGQRALEIARQGVATHSGAEERERLMESLGVMSEVRRGMGDLAGAEAAKVEEIVTRRAALDRFGETASSLQNLQASFKDLGSLQEERGDLESAVGSYRDALTLSRMIASLGGGTPEALDGVAKSLAMLLGAYRKLGQHGEADAILDEFIRVIGRPRL